MSLTQAIALNAVGSSSGEFEEWSKQNFENRGSIFSVLCKHLENDLTSFNPDNEFVYRLGKNYHFVPSTEQLYWLELEKLDPGKGKFFIKNLLGRIQHSGNLPEYDYVLFDCPPSFTILSYSVLTCCDLILIPFNPDFFAAKGISLLIGGLHHQMQPHPLPRIGVFANRARTYASQPTRLAQSWINDVRDTCSKTGQQISRDVHFMEAWIPDRASLRDAITNRKTPLELEDSFRLLWEEASQLL